MLRYIYTIIVNLIRLLESMKTMTDMAQKSKDYPDEYVEEYNYGYVKYVIDVMKKTGKIETEVFGLENLPKEGGYTMYPNHEGKWDVYGLMSVHKYPCSFVMDIKKSNRIFIKQLVNVLNGKRLSKTDNRQAMTIINEVAKEVEAGRKYVLFPEGDFDKDKKNNLWEFKAGCFKISLKSKTPIVPVVLYDSWKVYNSMSVGKVKSQVYYLTPIYYDEYKEMSTRQIADLVKNRIEEKIKEINKKILKSKINKEVI